MTQRLKTTENFVLCANVWLPGHLVRYLTE